MKSKPRWIREGLDHLMWTEERDGPGHDVWIACSCGWHGTTAVTWHDDVVEFEIRNDGHVSSAYVLAPPIVAPDQDGTAWVMASRVCFVGGSHPKPLSARNLAWLLNQPNLPDEFRRAAAVHLP